jgi:hypothetical protein
MMTLEHAWIIVESLNDDANQKAKDFWRSDNIDTAVRYQADYFRKNFEELDKVQRDLIQHWINIDDEFQDYFKCLSAYE